jgi:hypothetical protein
MREEGRGRVTARRKKAETGIKKKGTYDIFQLGICLVELLFQIFGLFHQHLHPSNTPSHSTS